MIQPTIFFKNACTKSGSLRFSQFSGWWLIFSVYILMSFDVFRLMTDFFCLYTYEFWFSLCKIARSSVILLLLLFTIRCEKYITAKTFTWLYELDGECFIRRRNCLLLVRTWDHLLFCGGYVCVAHFFSFMCCFFGLFVFVLCLVTNVACVSLNCPYYLFPSVFSSVYLTLIYIYIYMCVLMILHNYEIVYFTR